MGINFAHLRFFYHIFQIAHYHKRYRTAWKHLKINIFVEMTLTLSHFPEICDQNCPKITIFSNIMIILR